MNKLTWGQARGLVMAHRAKWMVGEGVIVESREKQKQWRDEIDDR